MPERPQAITTAMAREALGFLEEHIRDQGEEGPRDDFSWNLLKALEPFERRPKLWLRVICPRDHLVTRATYEDGGIFLGQETREKLPGGATLIRPAPGPTPNVELAHFPHPAGFENEPAGAHVWARRNLRCPRCRRTFTYGPVGLLRAYLSAVGDGNEVLVLGRQTPPSLVESGSRQAEALASSAAGRRNPGAAT